jgi:hypothetical protein
MDHERGLLSDVTRLREQARQATPATAAAVGQRFALEGELGQRVGQLLVSMEAYPELKSDRPVMEAQQTWTEIEAQITAARRFWPRRSVALFSSPASSGSSPRPGSCAPGSCSWDAGWWPRQWPGGPGSVISMASTSDRKAAALSSEAFSLGAFRDSGLVEPFVSAGVRHVLAGDAHGVPFALTEWRSSAR